ncbi:3-hydroxyacyl-ACP dehydratase FabZ [Acholeplasma hippikon]|uniref:3-hydroxyacyl-[acyl-carrier-protein] dehydratase n=1 Tax=Acholeplasma hippikon TaxID=264636 RepID=A0A449BI90_9MOLU|nr:3-hydroxyacyl-ACP dehydratase FabZ [Acholeplasma hippikon]VEU82165.1 (3R)-hydroxymyristoyl-[acyl-carrier-protein] dehydratase [Acholeplasma hippikon]
MALLNREQIKQILPHRDPFLMVDEVIELVDSEKCVGIKYVNKDEYYFKGHFPEYPVMPGVLILETMAQVGAIALLSIPEFKGKIGFFTGANNVKWRKQVLPGDTLKVETVITKIRGPFVFGAGKAYVEDKLVCEAEISFAIG